MKRIFFIEMMGEPGSYDASVYDHFEDKDQEGVWFIKRFQHIQGIEIHTRNVCIGERLPEIGEIDGLVLAGSYNSVHDNIVWQEQVRGWLPKMQESSIPILAICGSHQLISHMYGAQVEVLNDGPYAGTFPVTLTEAGQHCPIMEGISDNDNFQFANGDHVINVPLSSVLLASSGRVPVAALDFGNHCYSTQFHPEGTYETLGTVWSKKAPEKMKNYFPEENGEHLVENFLRLVIRM